MKRSLKDYLSKARKEKWAIAQFNFSSVAAYRKEFKIPMEPVEIKSQQLIFTTNFHHGELL